MNIHVKICHHNCRDNGIFTQNSKEYFDEINIDRIVVPLLNTPRLLLIACMGVTQNYKTSRHN